MAPISNSTTVRQLVIKTGVVNRVVRELQSYKDESATLATRVEKMEENKEDEYEIRQQKRVHAESLAMIPDSEQRLAKAVAELEDLIEAAEDEVPDAEELANAKKAVESSQASTG